MHVAFVIRTSRSGYHDHITGQSAISKHLLEAWPSTLCLAQYDIGDMAVVIICPSLPKLAAQPWACDAAWHGHVQHVR